MKKVKNLRRINMQSNKKTLLFNFLLLEFVIKLVLFSIKFHKKHKKDFHHYFMVAVVILSYKGITLDLNY